MIPSRCAGTMNSHNFPPSCDPHWICWLGILEAEILARRDIIHWGKLMKSFCILWCIFVSIPFWYSLTEPNNWIVHEHLSVLLSCIQTDIQKHLTIWIMKSISQKIATPWLMAPNCNMQYEVIIRQSEIHKSNSKVLKQEI